VRHTPANPSRRIFRVLASGVLALGLTIGVGTAARADDLDDKKNLIQQQIAANQTQTQGDKSALDVAAAALAESNQRLAAAQADLSAKQKDVREAQAADAALAVQVQAAQDALAAAQAAVVQAKADVDAQQRRINGTVQMASQQDPTLLGLSLLLTGASGSDLNNSVQWATTMFDTSQAAMDRLHVVQATLEAAEAAAKTAADELEAKKHEAEQHLQQTQQLEQAAQQAARAVAAEVAANQKAKEQAAQAVADDQAEQQALAQDMASITQQIVERNARLEAERKAAEEAAKKKAAEEAAAKKAAEEAAAAAAKKPATSPSTPPSSTASTPAKAPSTSTFFLAPIAGPLHVTSSFGWRIDPITGGTSYHSGVDLGAGCGTPIRAAESGTVGQRGWYGTLGNYLVLDHGRINGSYWSTGYGHMSAYNVSLGQYVNRGDIIGYVGTTGRSTGCHLHFNAFKDGVNVNGAPLIGL